MQNQKQPRYKRKRVGLVRVTYPSLIKYMYKNKEDKNVQCNKIGTMQSSQKRIRGIIDVIDVIKEQVGRRLKITVRREVKQSLVGKVSGPVGYHLCGRGWYRKDRESRRGGYIG